MKTLTKNLTVSLALALGMAATGCATDVTDDMDDDGGGGGGGGGGGDVEPKELDASGRYELRSNFDLATNAPGKVGEAVNMIIAATDGPADPTEWILEQVIAKMPNGTLKNLLNGSKSFVAGYLNDRLLEIAPDFVPTMVQLGNDFGQAAKNFGLNETLEVTKAGGAYMSTHTVLGVHFKIDNVESNHLFSQFNIENTVVQNVGVTLDQTGTLGIADHKVSVSYGKVLRIGLDAAIIPMLDPTAQDLGDLLANTVDCNAVGDAIGDAIGFGHGTFTTACGAGLEAGAAAVYSKIAEIDGTALELGLTGAAKGLDKNGDGSVDSILTGNWTGEIKYGDTPAPLAGATFYGLRM